MYKRQVVSFVCSVVSLFGRNCVCIECCVDTANVSSNVSLTNNLFFCASLVYSLLEFSYVAVVKDGDADNLFVAVNVSLCLDFEVTVEFLVIVILNGVFCINRVAVSILNEMCIRDSYKTVRPVYYDVQLSGKVARDKDSVEMLDIIFEGRRYEMAYIFGANQLGSTYITATANGTELASQVAKLSKVLKKTMDKQLGGIIAEE